MAVNTLQSYALNGVKESFANWISNISPTDTPFVSMTGKEAITNKYFQWQTDKLSAVNKTNAQAEGSDADSTVGHVDSFGTTIEKNVTQILRKVVKVSDTSDALSSYGRGGELAYQMEKAGAEIKRDLEWAFLNNGKAVDLSAPGTAIGSPDNSTPPANNTGARVTAGFVALVATKGDNSTEDPQAIVHQDTSANVDNTATPAAGKHPGGTFVESELFEVTKGLYLAGANPNIIMFHPKHAKVFSSLMETGLSAGTRERMFDGATDTKINTYVSTLVDPLGQEFKLIPNRFMPDDKIYIFNPSDWTQMVLRTPQRIKLAKDGSYEKWMIEMEVGLRHRNKFASGILEISK